MSPAGPPASSSTSKAVKGVSWSMLAVAGRQVMSLAGVAVLARMLGPEAYGLLGMAALITTFLMNFRDLGTAAAVIQKPSINDRMLTSLFWVNMLFGAVLAALVVLAAGPAAEFFHDERITPVLRILAISFPITSAGVVHQALLSRELAFHRIAWADLASSAVGYVVAIPMATAGFGVWSLVAANLVNALVSTALYWLFCPWRPRLVFDKDEVLTVSKFSLNLGAFGLVNYFSRNADNLIIGRMLGSEQLGYYQMAYNLMLYPIQNVSAVISRVLFPTFARMQDDDERFRSAYTRSCLLVALVTFPLMGGMGAVAGPLVHSLLGSKWSPAILTLQILAPVGLAQSVFTTVGQIYISKGRTDWMLYWGTGTAVLLVSSFLLGIRYGIEGVAAAYSFTYLVLVIPLGFLIPFRLIGLRLTDFLRPFLPQLAITASMVVASLSWLWVLDRFFAANSWVQLITTVLLGVITYTLGLAVVYPPALRHLVEDVLKPSHSSVLSRAGAAVEAFCFRNRR